MSFCHTIIRQYGFPLLPFVVIVTCLPTPSSCAPRVITLTLTSRLRLHACYLPRHIWALILRRHLRLRHYAEMHYAALSFVYAHDAMPRHVEPPCIADVMLERHDIERHYLLFYVIFIFTLCSRHTPTRYLRHYLRFTSPLFHTNGCHYLHAILRHLSSRHHLLINITPYSLFVWLYYLIILICSIRLSPRHTFVVLLIINTLIIIIRSSPTSMLLIVCFITTFNERHYASSLSVNTHTSSLFRRHHAHHLSLRQNTAVTSPNVACHYWSRSSLPRHLSINAINCHAIIIVMSSLLSPFVAIIIFVIVINGLLMPDIVIIFSSSPVSPFSLSLNSISWSPTSIVIVTYLSL